MLNPQAAERAYEEGKTHTNNKEYELAKAKFTQAINLDPSEPYYFARAYVCMLTSDFTRAWSDLQDALRLDSNSVRALSALGFIAKQQKNYAAAIAFYTRAIEIAPKAAELYRRRAQVYMDAGMNEQFELEKNRFGFLLLSGQDTSREYMII